MTMLATARLRLRPLDAGDVDEMHALWNDPDVRRYLWDDVAITRRRASSVVDASEADFAAHRFGLWAVERQDAEGIIGFCGLRSADDGPPDLVYGFLPAYWGQGYATESARAVLAYALESLGVREVVAATDAPNTASVRVLERAGLQFERRGLMNGLDTCFYRLTVK